MDPATPPIPAAAPALTLRLLVDPASRRVLFAEAGEDAVAFLSTLLATPVGAAVDMLLQEDPPSAAAGCFPNLSAAGDRVSRTAGSACPCASCGATRTRELHFLEPVFFKRADGSSVVAAASRRGGGRSGDTFYRCLARGRFLYLCRGRVTDERGVVCPLCHSATTVTARLVKGGDKDEGSSTSSTTTAPGLGCYGIMDDLAFRNMAEEGSLSRAALLAELGVAEDPAAVREEVVPLGYKQGLTMLWASLQTKTVLTDVFLRATATDAPRRRRR
ncbi:hypothetical protein QOZ80_1BG0058580 [Eleusine coracana subsp. coracana]|nr:hypothetical protein QOZ80_1BG0058580 [Eleusine coracana subsp. coracana]